MRTWLALGTATAVTSDGPDARNAAAPALPPGDLPHTGAESRGRRSTSRTRSAAATTFNSSMRNRSGVATTFRSGDERGGWEGGDRGRSEAGAAARKAAGRKEIGRRGTRAWIGPRVSPLVLSRSGRGQIEREVDELVLSTDLWTPVQSEPHRSSTYLARSVVNKNLPHLTDGMKSGVQELYCFIFGSQSDERARPRGASRGKRRVL